MMLQGFKSDLLFICAWSLAFQILEKGKIFVLHRVEGRCHGWVLILIIWSKKIHDELNMSHELELRL